MRIKNALALICTAITLNVAGTAAAVPLAPGEWSVFQFGNPGSAWDRTFEFAVTGVAELRIVDGYKAGDRFDVYGNGEFLLRTRAPSGLGEQIATDWPFAYAHPEWSAGITLLGPGSYKITGIAVGSPFEVGYGAVHVEALSGSVAPVPLPAPALLLLSGLAALHFARRRRKV